MDLRDAKRQLLKDKKWRKEYEKIDLAYEIGKKIVDARIAKKMTQDKLAELVGTKQPSIARLESGKALPSLSFLQKIAGAFDTQLLPPNFQFMEGRQTLTITERIYSDYPLELRSRVRLSTLAFTNEERKEYAYA